MNELALAQMKVEMRNLYKNVGLAMCFQCTYELLISAQILLEVIIEEREKEKGMAS